RLFVLRSFSWSQHFVPLRGTFRPCSARLCRLGEISQFGNQLRTATTDLKTKRLLNQSERAAAEEKEKARAGREEKGRHPVQDDGLRRPQGARNSRHAGRRASSTCPTPASRWRRWPTATASPRTSGRRLGPATASCANSSRRESPTDTRPKLVLTS